MKKLITILMFMALPVIGFSQIDTLDLSGSIKLGELREKIFEKINISLKQTRDSIVSIKGTLNAASDAINAIDSDVTTISNVIDSLIAASGGNTPPSNITSSQDTIIYQSPINTNLLQYSTTDVDLSDTHNYQLVPGEGSDDNAFFEITPLGYLRAKLSINSFNVGDTIKIRVRTSDGKASFDKAFAYPVKLGANHNWPPSKILISNNSVLEGRAINYTVGTLSLVDQNTNSSPTFQIIAGTDSSQFYIDGNAVKTKVVLAYDGDPRQIIVRGTDDGSLYVDETIYINVTDVNSAPTNITLSKYSIDEGNAAGLFSKITVTDADDSSHNITLSGGANDSYFHVSNDSLYIDSVLNYDNIQSLTIQLQADDGKGGIYSKNMTITVNDTVQQPTISVFIHVNFTPSTTYEGDGDFWNNFVGDEVHKSTLLDTLGNEIDISLTLNGLNSSNRSETSSVSWLPTVVKQTRFDNSTLGQSGYATIAGMDANQEGTIIYTGYANQNDRDGAVYFNDVFMDSIDNQTMSDTVMWNFTADVNGELEIHFDPSSTFMYIDYLGIVIGEYGGTLSPGSIEAPSALTLTVDTPDIVLNWVDNSDSESGFYIYHRLATDSVFTNIDNVAANVTTYTDLSVEEDTAHYYYVVAYNDSLVSDPSGTVNGIISTSPPATPTGLTGGSTENYVYLSWDEPVSTNKVEVYRSTGGSFVKIGELGGIATAYQDHNVSIGNTYGYRIKFINSYGSSFFSNTITILVEEQADVPYIIPILPTYEDWGITQTIYIDGDAGGGGTGTIGNPYNSFSNQGGDYTRYLIKRGTTISIGSQAMGNYLVFDAYGEGEKPIIDGGMNFRYAGNHHVIVRNLHLTKSGGGFTIRIFDNPQGGFYFEHCKIMGDEDSPASFNVYGAISPMMFYHCELGWAVQDNILGSDFDNSYIVSCWFHHANRGNSNDGRDPNTTGDNIQFLLHDIQNFYGANNFLDRDDSWWKYNWILSNPTEGVAPADITLEYNTFKSAVSGQGGAMLKSGRAENYRVAKNIFYGWEDQSDHTIAQTGANLTDQEWPYGLRDNIMISRAYPRYFWDYPITTDWGLEYTNKRFSEQATGDKFDLWSDYREWSINNGEPNYGSDLDINNDGEVTEEEFWDLWVDPREGGTVTPTINTPTNLTATVSGSDIVLNWLDNSTNETGFAIVHRLDTGSVLVGLDSVAANITTYTMSDANVDTTHYFGVYAFNSSLDSDTSNIVNISITTAVPAKPVNVVAEAQADGQSIVLSWSTLPLANKYYIRKSTDNSTFYDVKSVTAPQTSWEDVNVSQTNTYYYDVRGYNNFGYGEYSDTASATVPIPTETAYNIPTRPTAGDWGITDTLYIDGDAAGGGDGSIGTPYNVFSDQGGSKTLYYIKRGTIIPAVQAFSDSIIWEPYGSGAQPIVSGKSGFMFADNDYFVADSIHFYAPSYEAAVIRLRGNDGSHNYGTDNQQYFWFFNCQVLGNPADPASRGISGAGPNTTIYRCEIAYTRDDGIWGSDWTGGKIVSNWIHHVGLGNPTDNGDIFQIPWNNAQNLYIANNFMDHSATVHKYCLIINSGFQYGATNNRVVYNTFKAPATGHEAAIIKTGLGNQGTVSKNILYGWEDSNVAFFHSYDSEVLQSDPYGVKDNVLIGTNPIMANAGGVTNATTMLSLQFNGTVYSTWNAWRTLWLSSGQPNYGSDLVNSTGTLTKTEFWGTATP